MKKTITIIFAAIMSCIMATAQNSYYYYNGGKKLLTESRQQVVTISPLTGLSVSPPAGLSLIKSVSDSRSRINVYKIGPAQTVAQVKAAAQEVPGRAKILSCYVSESGLELAPTGYVYVKLKSANDYQTLKSEAEKRGMEIVEQNKFMPLWYTLRVKDAGKTAPVDAANALYETGLFESSSPDFHFDALEFSYDPDISSQWGLYNSQYEGMDISISSAWNYATGNGIKIAIVDEGVELTHQDLAANIYHLSYDTETGTSPSQVYGDHGTHCAGIAAAVRNNGIQIAGVAPDAKIMPTSTDFSSSKGVSDLADGINWAWMNGADVISCSWNSSESDIIKEAIDNAVTRGRSGKGCVFVKSAGNTYGAISFPGDYRKEVLAVANMTVSGTLNISSAYGDNQFVTAPGTDILSTVLNNATAKMSGTSMAAPHVAGVAALILERNPRLTAEKVREIIGKHAKKVGAFSYGTTKEFGSWNKYYGYGLVNAYEAVINTPRN